MDRDQLIVSGILFNPRLFDDGECSICYEAPQIEKASPPCGHVCCYQCLIKWSRYRSICPVCTKYFSQINDINGNLMTKIERNTEVIQQHIPEPDDDNRDFYYVTACIVFIVLYALSYNWYLMLIIYVVGEVNHFPISPILLYKVGLTYYFAPCFVFCILLFRDPHLVNCSKNVALSLIIGVIAGELMAVYLVISSM